MLKTGEDIAEDIERPIAAASNVVVSAVKKTAKIALPKKRFYKKVLWYIIASWHLMRSDKNI